MLGKVAVPLRGDEAPAGDLVGPAGERLAFLTTDDAANASDSTRINARTVTTTGDQTYNDDVALGTTVTFAGANISFNENLDAVTAGGRGESAIVAATGKGKFGDAADDAVGGTNALGTLTTTLSDANNAAESTEINAGTVTTTRDQLYLDNVVVGSNVTFTSGTNVTFRRNLNAAEAGANREGATINAAGTSQLGDDATDSIGEGNALAFLRTDAAGETRVGAGRVTTAGDQTYNDNVRLDSNVTFSGTNISFNLEFSFHSIN